MKNFGLRLAEAMEERGPVCVGIDPHADLLGQWDLPDSAKGVREFSLRVIDALWEHAAALKPQSAFFERHGAAGVAVLEEIATLCKQAHVACIMDVKRGDIGSTMDGYADAYLRSPLAGDALTVSPYLGPATLEPLARQCIEQGYGFFALALTSNPEGAAIQHQGSSAVAKIVVDTITRFNRELTSDPLGPFGLVVGATVGAAPRNLGIEFDQFPGIFLAPGVGAQGAGAQELRDVFGTGISRVLASASRSILRAGPAVSGLRDAFARTRDEVAAAL